MKLNSHSISALVLTLLFSPKAFGGYAEDIEPQPPITPVTSISQEATTLNNFNEEQQKQQQAYKALCENINATVAKPFNACSANTVRYELYNLPTDPKVTNYRICSFSFTNPDGKEVTRHVTTSNAETYTPKGLHGYTAPAPATEALKNEIMGGLSTSSQITLHNGGEKNPHTTTIIPSPCPTFFPTAY